VATQNFSNHAKLVPSFHFTTLPASMVVAVYFCTQMVQEFSVPRLMMALLSIVLFSAVLHARTQPLGVQDRLIRLEERMRLGVILPADMQPRIGDLSTDQLIGLRFASDEELPDLVRRTLAGEFANRKAIKAAVKNWRADNQRI
jgi:hypothetical protein